MGLTNQIYANIKYWFTFRPIYAFNENHKSDM